MVCIQVLVDFLLVGVFEARVTGNNISGACSSPCVEAASS